MLLAPAIQEGRAVSSGRAGRLVLPRRAQFRWRFLFASSLLCMLAPYAASQPTATRTNLAVLDFGGTATGSNAAERLWQAFSSDPALRLMDRQLARAAAVGNGYAGSLNLTLAQARDLGAAIGCDFYLIGDAQTIRRSPSTGPIYYESYASVFIVSARSGRLILWDRPSFTAPSPDEAEKLLLAELGYLAPRYIVALRGAKETERNERASTIGRDTPVIEEAPAEGSPDAAGFRPPLPYRRLRPNYPDTAARAEAEATVDVLVDLDVEGEVRRVEIERWAGFGLDEATINTVRQMHFRPAMRNGTPYPLRVLLRYNFRRPVEEKKQD